MVLCPFLSELLERSEEIVLFPRFFLFLACGAQESGQLIYWLDISQRHAKALQAQGLLQLKRADPTDAPFFFLIAFVSVLARLLSCFSFLAALAYRIPKGGVSASQNATRLH